MALFDRGQGLLIVGDYLSDVEIPMDPTARWPTTAPRWPGWRRWWRRRETVVPGHGSPHDRDTALRLLDEDVDYLDALERGEDALPEGRDSKAQREIHAENVAAV